jgi:hypothetical protein
VKYKNPTIISKWFNCVQAITAQYNILLENTFNFNKTRYAMGVIVIAKVITETSTHYTIHIRPRNREWITTVKYISATEWVLSSMLIFAGKVYIST